MIKLSWKFGLIALAMVILVGSILIKSISPIPTNIFWVNVGVFVAIFVLIAFLARQLNVQRDRSEEKLKDYQAHLEQLVLTRTNELKEINDRLLMEAADNRQSAEMIKNLYNTEQRLRQQLEAQMTQRIEFTRILVHELKTPLTALIAASDLLTESTETRLAKRLSKQINRGALALNKRITELFDMTKGEIGILTLRSQSVMPDQILESIGQYFDGEAHKKQITLEIDWPPGLPAFWGDQERIIQVLMNLMDNAFKYTRENGKIYLRAKQIPDSLLIEVEDTGCGIPADKLDEIFEPYKKIKQEHIRSSGMGLGLSLSKLFIELHNGKIWANSEEGKGSIFSFTLPYKQITSDA